MKLTKREKKIIEAWDMFDEPDVSTERLFAMVGNYLDVDAGDISGALYKQYLMQGGEPQEFRGGE